MLWGLALNEFLLYHGAPADLIDRCMQLTNEPKCLVVARHRGVFVESARELGDDPAAVATRRTEADMMTLDHDHRERRIELLQVVGRPQPGETTTHHDDVGLEAAVQRRALRLG